MCVCVCVCVYVYMRVRCLCMFAFTYTQNSQTVIQLPLAPNMCPDLLFLQALVQEQSSAQRLDGLMSQDWHGLLPLISSLEITVYTSQYTLKINVVEGPDAVLSFQIFLGFFFFAGLSGLPGNLLLQQELFGKRSGPGAPT